MYFLSQETYNAQPNNETGYFSPWRKDFFSSMDTRKVWVNVPPYLWNLHLSVVFCFYSYTTAVSFVIFLIESDWWKIQQKCDFFKENLNLQILILPFIDIDQILYHISSGLKSYKNIDKWQWIKMTIQIISLIDYIYFTFLYFFHNFPMFYLFAFL